MLPDAAFYITILKSNNILPQNVPEMAAVPLSSLEMRCRPPERHTATMSPVLSDTYPDTLQMADSTIDVDPAHVDQISRGPLPESRRRLNMLSPFSRVTLSYIGNGSTDVRSIIRMVSPETVMASSRMP